MFTDDTIFAIFNVKHPNLILKLNFRHFRSLKTLQETGKAKIYLLFIEEILKKMNFFPGIKDKF